MGRLDLNLLRQIIAAAEALRRNGQVVGAIGVSGGSGSQDQAVATSGASAIQG
jgi:uncharacterized protein GlcG (DUF336 family)